LGRCFRPQSKPDSMFTKTLLPDTFRAIQLTGQIPVFQTAYLAGGTSLALQIGHRISVDLDFFTQEKFDENQLENTLKQIPGFEIRTKNWCTILGKIGDTSISLFYYAYPLLEKTITFEQLQLAQKSDLSAMKIGAVEDRGTRRDFIDLFYLAKEYSLDQMLEFFDKKYRLLDDHLYPIIRALGYFEDAEMETEMPRMLVDVSWPKVKDFFQKESLRLAKEKLNIPLKV